MTGPLIRTCIQNNKKPEIIKDAQIKFNKSLLDRYYFVYAEAVDINGKPLLQAGKPLIWGGTFNLCTKPTRFTIDGRNECAEKGFDKTGFMKIDTGKEQKWIMRFE